MGARQSTIVFPYPWEGRGGGPVNASPPTLDMHYTYKWFLRSKSGFMNHSPKFCFRFIKPFIKVINKKKEVETISILFLSIKHFLNLSHSSLKFKIFFPIRLQCSLFLNPWIVCRSEQKTGARLIVFLQRNQSGIKQFGRIHALHARLGHFRQY